MKNLTDPSHSRRLPMWLSSLTAGVFMLACPAWAQTVHHVDADLTTGANDGTSWANALQGSAGLHAALAAAARGDEVWLKAGRYIPSSVGDTTERFALQEDEVTIRGGFEGSETSPLQRRFDAGVTTVLSGDLLGNDDGTIASTQDNSARVLHVESSGVILEDLRITAGGNEPDGVNLFVGRGPSFGAMRGTKVRRCRCDHSAGAGAHIRDPRVNFTSDITPVTDSTFDFNQDEGLILDLRGTSDCVLTRNRTLDNGGVGLATTSAYYFLAVEHHISARNGGSGIEVQLLGRPFCDTVYSISLRLCTVVDNVDVALEVIEPTSIDCAAGIEFWGGIAWDNNAGGPQLELPAFFVGSVVTDSIVGAAGGIAQDPQFRDQAGGDYSLQSTSPGVDALGPQPSSPLGTYEFDARGQHRLVDVPGVGGGGGGPVLDMGALELTGSIGRHVGCGTVPNSTGRSGRLFARGNEAVSANSLSMRGDQLPPGQFAMLLASRQLGASPAVAGPGTLCLGGAIGRFNGPGQIQPISAAGLFQLPVDLNQLPQPSSFVAAAPGETWRFQLWHRDVPGPSQFSGVVTVPFR